MLGERVKITVLRRLELSDELDVHMPPPPGVPLDELPSDPRCPVFHEGQTFLYHLTEGVPEGFCDWAWNDIFKDILTVCSRAAMLPPGQHSAAMPAYPCCTDGLRPVIFKIEALD